MGSKKNILDVYLNYRKTKPEFNLVPIESIPSLPIPIVFNKIIYLGFLYYIGKRTEKDEKIKLYRPNSKLIINPKTGKIQYFVSYTIMDEFEDVPWDKPIGEFPHGSIRKLTLQEYGERKNCLISKYETVFEAIDDMDLNQDVKDKFRDEFYSLCEPALLPFLKKIGASFFRWLDA